MLNHLIRRGKWYILDGNTQIKQRTILGTYNIHVEFKNKIKERRRFFFFSGWQGRWARCVVWGLVVNVESNWLASKHFIAVDYPKLLTSSIFKSWRNHA